MITVETRTPLVIPPLHPLELPEVRPKLPSELLEGGWCQHSFNVDRGGGVAYCIVGALVAFGESNSEESGKLARRVTNAILPSSVVAWNDTHGRTQQEVVDLMRKAEQKCGLW